LYNGATLGGGGLITATRRSGIQLLIELSNSLVKGHIVILEIQPDGSEKLKVKTVETYMKPQSP
jgi:hypothetical protein